MTSTGATGVVVDFDERRGIGVIDAGGGARYGFHAATIADGSRRIDVGATVAFERLARFGTWEATAITPLP